MLIFWIKAHRDLRFSIFSMAVVFLLLMPISGFALEISAPVGVQQIGRHLDLKSTLSNMPEGTESQLRSTCLKARFHSLESGLSRVGFSQGKDLLVNFEPTIKRGGLLEFKSNFPVNESLMEIELISECPLVVFKSRWTLIMKESDGVVDKTSNPIPRNWGSNFDPAGSSILASSRKKPEIQVKVQPQWIEKAETAEVEEEEVQALPDLIETNDVIQMVELDAELVEAGMLDVKAQPGDKSVVTVLNEHHPEPNRGSLGLHLMWTIGLSLSVLLLFVIYVKRKYWLNMFGVGVNTNDLKMAGPHSLTNEPHIQSTVGREQALAFSAEGTSIGSQRVLESLLGGDDHGFTDGLDDSVLASNFNPMDTGNRSSLKISLESINRADIPSWNLPEPYFELVESRNRALELHRTPDALLLRGQIGLVELAFQDAKQGQATSPENAFDLLEQVLGDQLYEIESKPSMCVPDVVKSLVRVKMCEITGAEKRQLLHENLLGLNMQGLSPAVCFSSNAWREFLSEEGILD